MKADILLILKDSDGDIIDAIIIENKLSARSPFTVRQIEGFGAIIDGQTVMTTTYTTPSLEVNTNIPVSNNKIFRCTGNGTVDISSSTLKKIIIPL